MVYVFNILMNKKTLILLYVPHLPVIPIIGVIATKVQINVIVRCLPKPTIPDGKRFIKAAKATNVSQDAIGYP